VVAAQVLGRYGAQSVTTPRYRREEQEKGNGQERHAEARTACGKESLSSLCKAASHLQRSYGEEGVDDRRSASKDEKERFHIAYSCKLFRLNKKHRNVT
jgi:hypothetical protein